jgi:hypothetical protein
VIAELEAHIKQSRGLVGETISVAAENAAPRNAT